MKNTIAAVNVGLFLFAFNIYAAYLQQSATVPGTEQKNCMAYLHALPDSTGLPIILTLAGTGVYSTGDLVDRNGVLRRLVDQKKAVVVTVDKPGIVFSETAPNKYTIDDAIYNIYTQRDLIACAENALRWASALTYSSVRSDIYILGHSEGTQVAVRIYKTVLSSDPLFAQRIKTVFLSGTVMSSWEDIINSQLHDEDKGNFWKAIANHDDKTLREMGNIAHAYWKDILNTEANSENLKALANAAVPVNFQVYQGINDTNTRAESVMEFETWNQKQKQTGKPYLRFSARYYNAGHALNPSAYHDMLFAFWAYLNP